MTARFSVDIECRCGCGERITEVSKATYYRLLKGNPVGYLPGHSQRGASNPNWKGYRAISSGGYSLIYAPDHPNARGSGYVLEHRLVMSIAIGRPLMDNEIVHHRNGNKLDNQLQNLEIVSREQHSGEIHPPQKRRTYPPKICPTCGKEFLPSDLRNYNRNSYCSHKCSAIAGEGAHHAKLTDIQVSDLRQLKGSLSHRELAKMFSISKTQVGRILRGESR